jgi:hypothetical protein
MAIRLKESRCARNHPLSVAVALLALLVPAQARSQTLLDLLASIRQGGGWIDVPVQGGKGSLLTPVIPTGGLDVNGCFRVWGGHSGLWDFDVRDTQGDARLQRSALPDQAVPFRHATGPLAQLNVQVRWSEPRDTTLLLWVGLRTPNLTRDPCQPIYGSPAATLPGRPPGRHGSAALSHLMDFRSSASPPS